jgi:exoribonuclease II
MSVCWPSCHLGRAEDALVNVFFEESGAFKTASVLSQSDASLQVSLVSGRRLKLKANQVLVSFEQPAAEAFLEAAQQVAEGLEADFLWDCAPTEDFAASAFAREVFGASCRPVDEAGLILALHGSPMHFYKKGRGVYRPAPAEALEAARVSALKKQQRQAEQDAIEAALRAGELPAAVADQAMRLLVNPDKQSVAFKGLEAAAHHLQQTPARLLLSLGGIPSAYALHRGRLLAECYPQGAEATLSEAEASGLAAEREALLAALPKASPQVYSIDDAATTEVDDGFSLEPLADGGWRVGVHIAAPGLLLKPGSAVADRARERASTAYCPGEKFTMLAAPLISLASLDEGRWVPAVSLYVEFDAAGARQRHVSRVEQVWVARNIRHGDWEHRLEQAAASADGAASDLPWEGLPVLYQLACGLRAGREAVRGRPEPVGRTDFSVGVDWDADDPDAVAHGHGTATLGLRARGSPVDILVSEFMILTNVIWGETIALGQLPGIYRCQSMGRVRMQTQPGAHQGLGVSHYAWSSSPLRRYADLVNQWQLLSILGHGRPAFRPGDAGLFADLAHFEARYDRYAEFQAWMERYWSIRWLGQQAGQAGEFWQLSEAAEPLIVEAVATRQEGQFRLRAAPIGVRVSEWSQLAPGTEVEVRLLRADGLEVSIEAKGVRVISTAEVDRYAVLGDPISHSKSPAIHQAFAEQLDEPMQYGAIQVAASELAERLDALAQDGYRGMNLTIPLKEVAFALLQERGWPISPRASSAQAVNTLIRIDQGWQGDNTDGAGLVRDIQRLLAVASLAGHSILILGAGGAARGVVGPLLDAGAGPIWMANRSLDRAMAVAADHAAASVLATSLAPLAMGHAADRPFVPSLIINATAASLHGDDLAIDPGLFAGAQLVVDMMYGPGLTPFLQAARDAGAPLVADGLGMLVEQAAESFSAWRGRRPETGPVLEQLRGLLEQAA